MARWFGTAFGAVVLLAACGSETAADANGVDAGTADASTADAGDAPLGDGAPSADADAETSEAGPTFQSLGCSAGAGLAEGEHAFDLEGRSRRYILRLPKGYPGDHPWPLVLALHPNSSSAGYWDKTDGGALDVRTVLENDAVLVIAEAIDGQWRDYSQPESTWAPRIESELLYFDTVVDQVEKQLCIDTRSIFSMGFSGGGSFSGVLACRRTDIRAIAVAGSVIYFDAADCVGKSAAWISIGAQEMSAGRQAFRDFFRDQAGCAATTSDTPPPPCVAYDGCDSATPVHYCEHPDGHIWPDFASQAMWAFFSPFVSNLASAQAKARSTRDRARVRPQCTPRCSGEAASMPPSG